MKSTILDSGWRNVVLYVEHISFIFLHRCFKCYKARFVFLEHWMCNLIDSHFFSLPPSPSLARLFTSSNGYEVWDWEYQDLLNMRSQSIFRRIQSKRKGERNRKKKPENESQNGLCFRYRNLFEREKNAKCIEKRKRKWEKRTVDVCEYKSPTREKAFSNKKIIQKASKKKKKDTDGAFLEEGV